MPANNVKHRMTGTPTYRTWLYMRKRCENEKSDRYAYYGARGIKVCRRWKKFENFLQDMGVKPSPLHSLDRENNNGNYCKSNCRWATKSEQSNNTRRNVFITIDGVKHTVAEWARVVGIDQDTISRRLKLGWPPAQAVTRPLRTPAAGAR